MLNWLFTKQNDAPLHMEAYRRGSIDLVWSWPEMYSFCPILMIETGLYLIVRPVISRGSQNVIFALFPGCEVLDLAGPLQAFHEANNCGGRYSITIAATSAELATAQRLMVCGLSALPPAKDGDLIIVPGYDMRPASPPPRFSRWLRLSSDSGARVCSVCTGAFALGEAGLLDQRACTTHWKLIDRLQKAFPSANVARDRLFVSDGPITTSAGVASGIDMALWLIEQREGPLFAAQVAQEPVIYIRRDGSQTQRSVFLDHRMHLNSGVHRVQDHIISKTRDKTDIAGLAKIACMSPRSVTRAFRLSTGLSIAEFRQKVRLEIARTMLQDPGVTLQTVAEHAGFTSLRHFRRLEASLRCDAVEGQEDLIAAPPERRACSYER